MENESKVVSIPSVFVVKNRAFYRARKNRAMLEGRKSKKFYTTKQTHKRVRNGKTKIVSKNG